MSRKIKNNKKKVVNNENKYNNYYVSKFINMIMIDGKKTKAEKIVYNCLNLLKYKYNVNPLYIFIEAIKKVSPIIELKKKKVGGTNYIIPVKISNYRGINKGMKIIIKNTRIRNEKKSFISLFKEIVETYNGCSNSIQDKNDIYKTAKLNRAFSHFVF
ncbi:30S ribosomal protein S7 [Candidatus Vidania fulgoroideorum]